MSCWDEDQYGAMSAGMSQESAQQPESAVAPKDSDGIVDAVEVIAAPVALLEKVVEPGSTLLPHGLAILGAAVVAVLWANSINKNG